MYGNMWSELEREGLKQEARKNGEAGQAWAGQLFSHSGNTATLAYMHVSMAHLEELTMANGHPHTGDDELLEVGHRPAKKIKEMTYHVGTGDKQPGSVVTQERRRKRWVTVGGKKVWTGAYDKYTVTYPAPKSSARQVLEIEKLREYFGSAEMKKDTRKVQIGKLERQRLSSEIYAEAAETLRKELELLDTQQ